MGFQWIKESNPVWDEGKQRIVGKAPAGISDRRYAELESDQLVPGGWWRAEEDGRVVGYGWLDVVWGDAEILLATNPAAQKDGVGSFILEHLEDEGRARGLNYLYNVVRPTHPNAKEVTSWLEKRGFKASEDGSLLRVVVPKARSADE